MQMLCLPVRGLHYTASRTVHANYDFLHCVMERDQSPTEVYICYEMCCDVEVCDQNIHMYSVAAAIPFPWQKCTQRLH